MFSNLRMPAQYLYPNDMQLRMAFVRSDLYASLRVKANAEKVKFETELKCRQTMMRNMRSEHENQLNNMVHENTDLKAKNAKLASQLADRTELNERLKDTANLKKELAITQIALLVALAVLACRTK